MSSPEVRAERPPRRLGSHLRSPVAWAVAMGLVFVVSLPVPAWEFFADPQGYVALHMALEFVAMAVGAMVFALSWNLRKIDRNSEIIILGTFSLAIVLIDLAHILSFDGMPDLVTGSSPDKSIAFWLPARILAAIALLLVAVLPARRWPQRIWIGGVLAALVVAALVWWIGLYHIDWLPRFFIPGEGLTTVKLATEYAIAALYGLAALLLILRSRRAGENDFAWLACAAWVLVLSEVSLTFYDSVTDTFNLLGHVFKVIAYLMIYRATFVAGVQTPYRQLERETSLMRSLMDSIPDLITYTKGDGRYAGANRAFTSRFGVDESAIIGQAPAELAARLNLSDRTNTDADRFEEVIAGTGPDPGLFDTLRTPYYDASGRPLGVIEVSRDITSYREQENRIEELALFDQRTGLPNRQSLQQFIERRLSDSVGRPRPMTLLLVQLNDFATINDTVGHEGGDAILREAARRLIGLADEGGYVARVGGDEFGVLLHDRTPPPVVAAEWIEGLIESLSAPFAIGEQDFLLTCAVGVAGIPEHADAYETLYRAADTAMYRASLDGGSTYRVFSNDMQRQSALRLQLLSGLRTAVRDDQLRLHYQPQVSLADGTVSAVEGLLRWEHPDLGLLPPQAFIALAEESGLILPIGEWVIRTAIRDAQAWDATGLPPVRVAVNLSAVQFRQPDLAEAIGRIVAETDFAPERLELELTESVAMRNPEQAESTIRALTDLGIRLAIDDFGTGYSSMAYLKRFHIHKLKIDRSFVADLGRDADDEAIVRAIIDMARALRCTTIAEGVETTTQLDFLRAHGCQEVQGYLISRPVPAGDLLPMLRGGSVLPVPAADLGLDPTPGQPLRDTT